MGLVRALAASCLLCACTDSVLLFGPADTTENEEQSVVGRSMAVGWYFSCINVEGRIACAGNNMYGVLGQPLETESSLTPLWVSEATDYRALDAGDEYVCAVRDSGVVECWGIGTTGQLGQGDSNPRSTPSVVALEEPAVQLCAGHMHACAVLRSGALWCWGMNSEGQLGQGESGTTPGSIERPVHVAGHTFRVCGAGQGDTCAIDESGRLYCWGRNSVGTLGLGASAAGQVRSPSLVELDAFVAIAVGQHTTCGIREGGLLYCWGVGPHGLVGGERYDDPMPIVDNGGYETLSIDTFHACATRNGGELWCWGRNTEGQLGLGDMLDRETPTRVGTDSDWEEVEVARFATCARKRDGRTFCTGENTAGELLTGDAARRASFTPVISP
jgi:alpha-tubulin suppressor-like RCC1 family protein